MRTTSRLLGCATALTLVAAPTAFAAGPNQGDPSKVLTADNTSVSCHHPVAGKKVEGGFGRTITVYSSSPIDKVTVKSGSKATVVSKSFSGYYKATIKLSQDVSNYVVWTCPKKY